jgi:hypothetical protein
MVTPIMITNIGWGTYLFFAVINFTFLPIIYFFYPETAGRSLEEIDIIFAKGHMEKMSYVKAAQELPLLSREEIDRMSLHYGLIEDVSEGALNTAGSRAGTIHRAPSEKSSDQSVAPGHGGVLESGLSSGIETSEKA